MAASSIPIHASSTSTRAQSRAGGWIASFDFDVASTSTPALPTIASTKESPSDSSTTTSTLTGPFCCNHQYSFTAITTSTGAIAERYAYTAYGQPTILNASGTPLSPQTSTLNSRYSYTGREWDATIGLYHFRARWMSGLTGRFLTRDPIAFEGRARNLYEFVQSRVLSFIDPFGTDAITPPNVTTAGAILQAIIDEAIRLGAIRDANGCVRIRVSDYMAIRNRLFPNVPIPDPNEWNRGCIGVCQQNMRVKCTGCDIPSGGLPEQSPVACFTKMPQDPSKVSCPKGFTPIIFSKQGKWRGQAPIAGANGEVPCDSVRAIAR